MDEQLKSKSSSQGTKGTLTQACFETYAAKVRQLSNARFLQMKYAGVQKTLNLEIRLYEGIPVFANRTDAPKYVIDALLEGKDYPSGETLFGNVTFMYTNCLNLNLIAALPREVRRVKIYYDTIHSYRIVSPIIRDFIKSAKVSTPEPPKPAPKLDWKAKYGL